MTRSLKSMIVCRGKIAHAFSEFLVNGDIEVIVV